MTEQEWLTSTNPAAMLDYLQGTKSWQVPGSFHPCKISDRKLRLFACACCRQVWVKFTDDRSRKAVQIAERFADGLATKSELIDSMGATVRPPYKTSRYWNQSYSGCAMWSCSSEAAMAARNAGAESGISAETQGALLRDIVGNPFRELPKITKCADGPGCSLHGLSWINPNVTDLAQGIYDERAFDRMPILHDALVDAGCDNKDVLLHLLGNDGLGGIGDRPIQGPHARGCFVLDLILGKD